MSTVSRKDLSQSGPTEDYKRKYEVVFRGDVNFARKFMPQVSNALESLALPKSVTDNEGTAADLDGHDLTLTTQIGVRVRRSKHKKYDQFTQDDKERRTMSCDVQFLGFANEAETQLDSWIVFDYKDYERQRGEWPSSSENIPCVDRRRNRKHSRVWFNGYQISDIIRHCRIFAKDGRIGWKQRPGRRAVRTDSRPPRQSGYIQPRLISL